MTQKVQKPETAAKLALLVASLQYFSQYWFLFSDAYLVAYTSLLAYMVLNVKTEGLQVKVTTHSNQL